jgi:hypothetical protein
VTGHRLDTHLADGLDCQVILNKWHKVTVERATQTAPESTTNGHHARQGGVDAVERARRYVAKMPEVVSGQRGQNAAGKVAVVLMRGFALPIDQARPVMAEFSARRVPPWSDREIEHKLVQARDDARLPTGYQLTDTLPRTGGRKPPPAATVDAPPVGPTAVEIIRDRIGTKYRQVYRSEGVLWSANEKRLIGRAEATAGADSLLIDQLAAAVDAPRDRDGNVRRDTPPWLFRAWAPTAWADVLASPVEQEDAADVDPASRDGFRALIRQGLRFQFNVGEADEVKRRPVIRWCERWARPGPWKDIRGYAIWVRLTWVGSAVWRLSRLRRPDRLRALDRRPGPRPDCASRRWFADRLKVARGRVRVGPGRGPEPAGRPA